MEFLQLLQQLDLTYKIGLAITLVWAFFKLIENKVSAHLFWNQGWDHASDWESFVGFLSLINYLSWTVCLVKFLFWLF